MSEFQQKMKSRMREIRKLVTALSRAVREDLPISAKLEAIRLEVWVKAVQEVAESEWLELKRRAGLKPAGGVA